MSNIPKMGQLPTPDVDSNKRSTQTGARKRIFWSTKDSMWNEQGCQKPTSNQHQNHTRNHLLLCSFDFLLPLRVGTAEAVKHIGPMMWWCRPQGQAFQEAKKYVGRMGCMVLTALRTLQSIWHGRNTKYIKLDSLGDIWNYMDIYGAYHEMFWCIFPNWKPCQSMSQQRHGVKKNPGDGNPK
jgi:hypothetical protein